MRRVSPRISRAVAEALEPRTLLALSPAGPEFRANLFTLNSQWSAATAMDGDGDFVIAWHSYAQDGSSFGVYARRYNAAGAAQGGPFLVNSSTLDNQNSPSVAMNPAGDFVVAWESPGDGDNYGIFARRYNAAGVPQGGEFRVNSFTTNFQGKPSAAMDASGNFLIAWQSAGQDGELDGVYAQRYNALGVPQGSEFRANTYTTSGQWAPAAAMDANGDSVITWHSYGQDGNSFGIYARRYNAEGVAQGTEFRVNSFTLGNQNGPTVAMDLAGDFVVAWASPHEGSVYGVYAQRFNSAGVAQGGEFLVNSYTTDNQGVPAAAMDADGDFAISWVSEGQDGSGFGIYAQSYNAAGVAQGTELHVSTETFHQQGFPAMAMDAAGDFVVAWQSYLQDGSAYGIYAQRYDESTDTVGPVMGGVFVNGKRALPYSVQAGPVTQIVVGFSEAVQNFGGPNSVANPVNWRVTHHNGSTASNVSISGIAYSFNGTTNRFEATLNLSGSFSSGNLQVMALDGIRDLAGNSLDGNLDGASGGAASLTFGIGTYTPRGGGFQVNSYTTSYQFVPAIGMDAEGDFVVAWMGYGQDGSSYGIYAQRYDATGVREGTEFQVNSFTTGVQASPAVAMSAEGDFVVAWTSYTQDSGGRGIYAQRYNELGVAQGSEFQVNTYTTNVQSFPALAMHAAGDFVVAWNSYGQDGDNYGIYARRYDAAGVPQGTEFQANSVIAGFQLQPSVAIDADGDFVVAWTSNGQDGSGSGVYARRYDALSTPQGTEFRVNTYTTNGQGGASVAMDAAGDFVVAWQSFFQDGDVYGIYAQRYNALGAPQGIEFRVNSYTPGTQTAPVAAMDAGGDFVVAWQSYAQDGSVFGIFAQRYSAAGVAQGSELRVNNYTPNHQRSAAVAMDPAGDFVIVWESNFEDGSGYGVYGQRYSIGATPVVGSLAGSPDPVVQGAPLTLTAGGVTDDMFALSMRFYREANGIAGLQFGPGGDTLVATDDNGGDGWVAIIPTASVAPGSYTYYAQASDDEGLVGAPVSAANTIIPLVALSQFYYDTLAQKLKFTFNEDVSASLSVTDITLDKIGGGPVPALAMLPYGTDGAGVASFSMNTQLADGNYRARINALGVTFDGHPMAADHVFDLFILSGDANHDRTVDARDLVILANNWFGSGKTFSQGDFNYDGIVNQADLTIMAQKWQQKLDPPPVAAASPAPAVAGRRTPVRTVSRMVLEPHT